MRLTLHCKHPAKHTSGLIQWQEECPWWPRFLYGALFRTEIYTRGGHWACSLEANMRVTNGIPLESPLLLPVCTVNCVETPKGSVGIFSEPAAGYSTLLSTIPVRELLGEQGHTDPHDAIFLPNGDIVVTCWKNPGEPTSIGTISYWERV
jgi:hypothetical protein